MSMNPCAFFSVIWELATDVRIVRRKLASAETVVIFDILEIEVDVKTAHLFYLTQQ